MIAMQPPLEPSIKYIGCASATSCILQVIKQDYMIEKRSKSIKLIRSSTCLPYMHMMEPGLACLVHLDPIDSASPLGECTGAPQKLAQDLFQYSCSQGVAAPFAVLGSDATGKQPWNWCLLHRIVPVASFYPASLKQKSTKVGNKLFEFQLKQNTVRGITNWEI